MNMNVTQTLRAQVHGQIVQPGDPDYDDARAVHNGMIDRRPALVVRCADENDVQTAIAIARDHGMPLAIRGGGHSGPGFGTCDGGVVADLGALRGVRVDPSTGTVRVGGGATWADVDRATAPHGLSVPCGVISSTGVGGLTLGGGHGFLARKYGLTIDNLLAADVILADGRRVLADASHEPDLFWALRGGGGNFGAVTAFTFQAHPVSTVIGGPMLWAWEDMPAMMRLFADRSAELPEDVYGFFAELIVPPGPPFPEALHLSRACAIVWCSLADEARTAESLDAFRRHRTPLVDFVGPLPMPAINSMFDVLYPKGTRSYWKGDFFDSISDEAIALHDKYGRQVPTVQSTMHI
jgi:FAD/FMN-containing dehydrogenase